MSKSMKKISVDVAKNYRDIILALGAESAGNFSVFYSGKTYTSKNFGDLLNENNFANFQQAIFNFLKDKNLKPNIILTDLHPEMKTTLWGKSLAKKFKAKHIQVQHHYAHIFSQIGGLNSCVSFSSGDAYGVALDGTGYGIDKKIWGGECFFISKKTGIERIGHLEYQTMIGGDLAIREPARMLISVLPKIETSNDDFGKNLTFRFVKKYYSKNEFQLLYNQMQQNFNCQKTSSAGRILDAVSVLLGFAENERKYKHQATKLLEQNSTKPYLDLKPDISLMSEDSKKYVLNTTRLFKYLIKNFHRDKRRLSATAQLYIAQGFYEIIKKHSFKNKNKLTNNIILSGGISDNKIISNYFISQKKLQNKKPFIARGDNGLSFGQILFYISKNNLHLNNPSHLANPWN